MIPEKNNKAPKIDNSVKAALIIFGRDDTGKPHASKFGQNDRQLAIEAAHLMGLQALDIVDNALIDITNHLPNGRIFESGKGFVPFVKREVCKLLDIYAKANPQHLLRPEANLTVVNNEDDTTTVKETIAGENLKTDDKSVTEKKHHHPKDWSKIEVGSKVLAVGEPDDGWWEAIVTHCHESGIGNNKDLMLTLEWEAWSDEPSFIRRHDHVALLHPSFTHNGNEKNIS